jgi:hypothetical protein
VTGRRCTICELPQVTALDALLSSGTPTRAVARMYAIPRTTLARHREHLAPTSRPLALIRGEGGPLGPADPLAEALNLAERARTPRQKLRALEQVRGATKLVLRGVDDPDESDGDLLDSNVRSAEDAYSSAADFETQARALSGLREAITHRLDVQPKAQAIEVAFGVSLADGTSLNGGATHRLDPSIYWGGVPKRFRSDRYIVRRSIRLGFPPNSGSEDVEVREVESNAIVWAKDTASSSKMGGKE